MKPKTNSLVLFVLFVIVSCKKKELPQPLATPANLNFSKAWGKAFGGNSAEWGLGIAGTTDGGYVVVGYTSSNDRDVAGFHGGPQDAWVVKVDATGNKQWQRCIGGTKDETAVTVMQLPDGGFLVAGGTTSTDGDFSGNLGGTDVFLCKLDQNGNFIWAKTYGSTGTDVLNAMIADGNGNYLVAGRSNDDAWVFKVNGSGTVLWEKKYGGTKTDAFSSLIADADGGFLLAGATSSSDGDVTGFRGGVGYDAWLVKIDNSGNKIWQKTYGGTSNESAHRIAPTADDGFLLVGGSLSTDGDMVGNHGGVDAFILRVDKNGNKLWGKMIGGTGDESAPVVVPSNDGGFLLGIGTRSISGELTTPSANGYTKGWIVKIDETGSDLGKKMIGGNGIDVLSAIAKGADGSYAITGSSNSTDGDVEGYQGYVVHDLWLLKFRDN